ncbi:MAG: type II secretion system protein M [Geobacteraceae bacterium]|nr:type II secretion system protein M [Geobacteraceae bacterium]
MKSGAEIIAPLKNWFLGLNKRERIMVAGAALLVPVYLLTVLVITPAMDEYRTLEQRLETRQRNNTDLTQQISELSTALQRSPNSRQRKEIERLEQQLSELHTEVGAHLDALVAPEQMPTILRRLLQHHPGLTLRSIHNTPAQIIRATNNATSDKEQKADADLSTGAKSRKEQVEQLYRQPLVLELEGPYLDILEYVGKIHAWPEHMFIDSVDISMDEYPRNIITLQVSSISTAESLLRGSSMGGEL